MIKAATDEQIRVINEAWAVFQTAYADEEYAANERAVADEAWSNAFRVKAEAWAKYRAAGGPTRGCQK